MKFGVCCSLEDVPVVLGAGFDYVELGASSLSDDPSVYKGLPVEATNLFFPGNSLPRRCPHHRGPCGCHWREAHGDRKWCVSKRT